MEGSSRASVASVALVVGLRGSRTSVGRGAVEGGDAASALVHRQEKREGETADRDRAAGWELEAAGLRWKPRWQDLVAEELAAVHGVGVGVEASNRPWLTRGQDLGGKPQLQTSVAGSCGRGVGRGVGREVGCGA